MGRAPDREAICLVQEGFIDLAEQRLAELVAKSPHLDGRTRIVVGDITKPDLGLGSRFDEIASVTNAIYHLAAVYDLSVSREAGMRVNVDGTRNVCDFATSCRGLERLHYVSTCFVSGRHSGLYTEEDLSKKDQVFNNHYEETKHLAEAIVRQRMSRGLPATIYRPAVVAGDSRTGETQKLDGIYYVIRWVLRQPRLLAVVPVLGDATQVRFNVVPSDYVVEAIAELSSRTDTIGKTYAIADPDPATIGELLDQLAVASGRRIVKVRLPLGFAKSAIRHVPGLMSLMGIPAAAADYFAHPTHYGTHNTVTALKETGILEWDRLTWIRALVDFTNNNMSMTSSPMV